MCPKLLVLTRQTLVCIPQNWSHVEDFAQLCYNPTPSLVTLDPCSKQNENKGTHQDGVFAAGGSQYEQD